MSQGPEDDPAVIQVRERLLSSELPAELDKAVLRERNELVVVPEYFIGFLYRQG